MDAEKVYLENLALIERITAFLCRRNRLQPADADDFISHVKLRLYEDDYAVLRKFEGRSSLSTYLTTVIQRLYFQYRVQMWGKWRPSAEARRLGDKAIVIERLLTRDGYTFEETVRELTMGEGPHYSRAEIEAIYLRLPQRQPRPVLVPEAMTVDVAADCAADDGVMRDEREQRARQIAATIDRTIASCDPEDRLILQMRFWQARKVPEIAATVHEDAKKLYKRIDRLIARLRAALADAGVPRDAIGDLLEHGDHNLTIGSVANWEKPPGGPSDVTDGETAKREGGLSQ